MKEFNKVSLLSIGLLIIVIIFTISLIRYSEKNQVLKYEMAELNGIQYGLLNVNEWEVKISSIILEQIDEFELTPENRENFSKSLENVLYVLIDEVEKLMKDRTSGSFSGIKEWAAGLAVDVDQLRDSVPEFSRKLLNEINKPETRLVMKNYLITKLHDFTESTYNKDEMGVIDRLIVKYGCLSKEECKNLLELRIKNNRSIINFNVISIIILVTIIFILLVFPLSLINKTKVTILILSALCLLSGGLLTPMIDLEARIDMLTFQLIGSPVVFTDQVFFFQSKSITDVVRVLISYGSLQMSLVAILVFSFSIVFPSLKLISSYIYYSGSSKIRQNIFIKFFTLKSGKWSMADVLVVAIFMSYISINGIIDNQLSVLTTAAKPVEIITTNGTALLGGFYLFFFFCIYGLLISEVVSRSK